jgi:hypothetical protein
MPATGVKALVDGKGFTVAKLANLYGASEQSATYRLDSYRRSLGL